MVSEYKLNWTYDPPNFFEEGFDWVGSHGRYTFCDGVVEVKLHADGASTRHIVDSIEQELTNIFKINNIVVRGEFTINCPTLKTPTETRVFIKGVSAKFNVGEIRALVGEEENPTNFLINKILPHLTDCTMKFLLDSYLASIRDPINEYTHLYEIRDRLCKRLGGQHQLEKIFNCGKDFSKFGNITCVKPSAQSRHRGNFENLEDTTQEDLRFCRGFARDLIVNYAEFLSSNTPVRV